jgi:NADP-reducing hydrogenase subunit HndD
MLMNRTTPFMVPVDEENPAIIKDEALCSQCGHCFAICEEEIGVAAKYLLNPRETYQCIGCGQCSANCPEKAIIGKPDESMPAGRVTSCHSTGGGRNRLSWRR